MRQPRLPNADEALPGRDAVMPVADRHYVNGNPMLPPFDGMEMAIFGMGCFWGAEQIYWQSHGVLSTSVGYAGGHTRNPSYEEVCSGLTGHTEAVRVVFDPSKTSFEEMLVLFWENHDPTQGMQQGNDCGTQYRSAAYHYDDAQRQAILESRRLYQESLDRMGFGPITTEIGAAPEYYYAEDYHQQYLAKNPSGYCGMDGTGVRCSIGVRGAGQ